MKTRLLNGMLVLAVLCGCSNSTASTSQNNNTLQANPTEDTTATKAPEETTIAELPTANDLEYVEYSYVDSIGDSVYVVSVKNNSDVDIRIDVNGVAYDANNNIIGAADDTNACIGTGEQSYIKFYFSDVTGIDHVDYKNGMQISQDDGFVPAISNLDVQGNVNGDVVTYSVKNNGEIAAEFVQVLSVFLDASNTVLYMEESYVTDSNSEIAAGATQVEQVNYYNKDNLSFDHIDWFVKGRGSK